MEFKRELVNLRTLAFCVITEPDPDGGLSILHQACIKGDLETVRLVLGFSPTKLDNAVASCLRVRENAQQFAGYTSESIARSLDTAEHEQIAGLLNNESKRFQRRSLLREIATRGSTAQMKRLVLSQANGSDWSAIVKYKTDHSGRTLLMSASSNNNSADMAEFLISEGAIVHTRDKNEKTALHFAACSNSTDVIEVLLKNGAYIHDADEDGLNALHHAAEHGHYETVERLVEKGCNLVKRTATCPTTSVSESSPRFHRSAGMTPLHFAAQNGHSNIVELLIKRGVDVNCKTARGWTSLMLASQGGHLETVRLLLRLGGEVEEHDISSNSALQYAARKCRLDIAELLIENGAASTGHHVNKKDMEKLLISAAKKRKPKLLKALLLSGYSSNASVPGCFDGGTLLHEAANVAENVDVIETLVRQGADIHARDKHGMTALHHAADVEAAALLITAGSDLSAMDKFGEVAAFHAARSNRWKLVQYFAQQGCEMNSLSIYGFSLLQLLATLGFPLPIKID